MELEFFSSPLYTLVAVVALITLSLVQHALKRKLTPHQLSLPPGPKGIPFLGSVLELDKNAPWITYLKWKEQYGEIVSCNLLGQTFIIINSERVAKLLLDQRSNIYSDRPVIETCNLFGMEFNTGHLSYGDTWRSHRKILHQSLNALVIPKHHQVVTEKARVLLTNLLKAPESFEDHMRTYASSIIMSIMYGYNVAPKDDPLVAQLEELMGIIILLTPERAALLNFFPQLLYLPSWFPGAGLQRLAKQCRDLSPKVREGPFQWVKESLAKGIENESAIGQLLKDENAKSREAYEQDIKDCAVSSFIAGTDTTQSTLTSLIMALVLFPKVQDRAQEIIDKVVGRDRLPTFEDRASLQFIDALLLETLRWAALTPMALPRIASKDDVFEECLIPKGSIVIPNLWGMSKDEERFPDPLAFKPERHLSEGGKLRSDDISGLWFSYGRRSCPGRYLATTTTWLAAASMLAVFRFNKAIGPAGYEIDFYPRFTGGVALRPVSFPCRITPRFEGAEELIN